MSSEGSPVFFFGSTARSWSAFLPPITMSRENSSTMIPPPIWNAGIDTFSSLRIASPRTANAMHTIREINTERVATRLQNSGEASAVSEAHTIVTFRGPIAVNNNIITSE